MTSLDPAISTEAQLQIDSVLIEETGLGYHVTFEIRGAEARDLLILLTDSNGDPLPPLPGYAETISDLAPADPAVLRVSCQLPEDDKLFFTVTDQDTGIEYGPYSIQ